RGFYLPVDSLPGPSVHSIEALVATVQVSQRMQSQYKGNYQKYKQKFVNYDDGQVTERVVNQVFHHDAPKNGVQNNRKERILIYPGGMKPNGITTSILNLLENVDYDRYDIKVFLGFIRNKVVIDNIYSVHTKYMV